MILAERICLLAVCVIWCVWAAVALVRYVAASGRPKPFDWASYEDLRLEPPSGFKLVKGAS